MAQKKSIDLSSSKLFGDSTVKETPIEESSIYEETKDLRESQQTGKRKGRPRNENLVQGVPAQYGLTEDLIRVTYIIPVELADFVQNYAYTERVKIQTAVAQLLTIGKKEVERAYKRDGKEILEKKK